ncbi:MAG TPA: hypothetical protein VGS22_09535 [Thermoanaerobaculia bacterium]|jgi:hypothetical protein|nr:hypothetical protein [Thermoanaerobaculia bacterium]
MLPRGLVAARTFVIVLFTLFLLTTPAFAAPRSEDHFGFSRVASFWSQLLHRVTGLFADDFLPPPTGGGGGGSGTSLDPNGLRRPVG